MKSPQNKKEMLADINQTTTTPKTEDKYEKGKAENINKKKNFPWRDKES